MFCRGNERSRKMNRTNYTRIETKNSLPQSIRRQSVELLNRNLASAIDLERQAKQAHWNVKGPNFIALHELFDKVAEAAEEFIDLLAERVTALGGVAEGTIEAAAGHSAFSGRLEQADHLVLGVGVSGEDARIGLAHHLPHARHHAFQLPAQPLQHDLPPGVSRPLDAVADLRGEAFCLSHHPAGCLQ